MREKSNSIRIAVDLLGGDTPAEQLLRHLLTLSKELKETVLFTFFISPDLESQIPKEIRAVVCDEVIQMDDDPLVAIRKKKNSSIVQGILHLKRREADAFISAGNTGALLAASHINLSLLPGIERPALLALLPTRRKEIAIIDVGANLASKAEHLFQFTLMGIAYQKSRGVAKPNVGLLNIGRESIKGTPELREVHQKLQKFCQERGSATFHGNVEGREAFHGELDLLVTDGFAGNIFLKTAEGLAAFILELVEEQTNPSSFKTLRQKLHYTEYPGAVLCGVDGIVMKCHGEVSPQSFVSSIMSAAHLVRHSFLDKVKFELQNI